MGAAPGGAPCRCQFLTGLQTPCPSLNHAGRACITSCVSHNIGDRRPRLSDVGVRYQRSWAGAREPDRLMRLRRGALEAAVGASGALVVVRRARVRLVVVLWWETG